MGFYGIYPGGGGGGGGGGGTPSLPFNSIQFNNAGSFGGTSYFTYDGSGTVTLSNSDYLGILNLGASTIFEDDGFGNSTWTSGIGQQIALTADGSISIQDSTGYTGGIGIAGGQTIIKQSIFDISDFESIDPNNRELLAEDGITVTVNWKDPTKLELFPGNAVNVTIGTASGIQDDGAGNTYLYGASSYIQYDTSGDIVFYTSSGISLQLAASSNEAVFGGSAGYQINFGIEGLLYDDGAGNLYLENTSTGAQLNFNSSGQSNWVDASSNGIILDGSGNTIIQSNMWMNGVIQDSSLVRSIDPNNRALFFTDGTTASLDWVSFKLSNQIIGVMFDWAGDVCTSHVPLIANGATIYTNAALTWFNGHLDNAQQIAPTARTSQPSATVTVSNNSTDSSGTITLTPGVSGLTGPASIFTLTFANAYANGIVVTFSPANVAAATAIATSHVYVTNALSTSFDLAIAITSGLTAAQVYNYHVIGID